MASPVILRFLPVDAVRRATLDAVIHIGLRIFFHFSDFDISGLIHPEHFGACLMAYAALNARTKVNDWNFHINSSRVQILNNLRFLYRFSNFTAKLITGFQRFLVRNILDSQSRIDDVKFHRLELGIDHFDGFTAPAI